MKKMTVSLTGAAGQIGYAMVFRIASGEIFGHDTKIHLKLLELEAALPALKGVEMELQDGAFPALEKITCTSSLEEAFEGANWVFLVGSVPRKAGMERGDLLNINGGIFTGQGKALDAVAHDNCKTLVVGNPCNTNALIAASNCKRLSKRNFFAMTMLDEKRAISQLAIKAGVHQTKVSNVAIWGNHSATQYPDFYNAQINGKPTTEVISNEDWLRGEFLTTVQQRGAAIIKARGASSAASAANAALETAKCLEQPTPYGKWFSVAVSSSETGGIYNISNDLMFSYPISVDSNGEWKVVPNLSHNSFSEEKIKTTEKELLSERDAVASLL